MAEKLLTDLPLWDDFSRAARRHRRNPARLLSQYMHDCLESWDDQVLDDAIRTEAQASGFHEAEAVDIVRQHRVEVGRAST